jgi:hypothetical protein
MPALQITLNYFSKLNIDSILLKLIRHKIKKMCPTARA